MKWSFALAFAAMLATISPAPAQIYPSRPITIVIPFPPGGAFDTIGRTIAERMKGSLGQPVILENAGGANGSIGVGRVARASPDGYTLSLGYWGTHVVNAAIYTLRDTEKEIRESKNPNGPFVGVSKNGELLPEVKQVISIIAKHGLTLASGHILAEETLMVFREAKRQGVQHMIATHAFDLSGKMTVEQMQEAAKLGAFIEFDFRNTLEGGRTDAIHKVGPQFSFISEFWTKLSSPRVYGGPEGVGAFAEAMRARGFTDRELEVMFKANPAKALGLKAIP